MVDLLHVRVLAEIAFGDTERADRWLRRRSRWLGGEAPLDVVCAEDGARGIETLLARIAWGAAF